MRKLNKRLCGLLLAVAMMLSLCCPALAAGTGFPDTEGHWAEAIIHTLAADGIIHGYEDGRCHPDAPITRGQFATLVARVMELTAKDENKSAFADTTEHWSADYIRALVKAGIIQPSDYGTAYEPDKEITRLEMVVMMVRAIGKESETAKRQGQTEFTDDAEITGADSGYINTAVEYGILVGYPNGTVRPYRGASRAEGFCMLMRMIEANKRLHEEAEAKGDVEDPKPNLDSSIGGGHSGSWSVPAPQISFTLSKTAHVGDKVTVSASVKNETTVVWTLTKDGVSEEPEGFTAEGGTLTFFEAGVYTLTAVATNSTGETAEYEQNITIYPIVGVAFSLPTTAHTDTMIPVDLLLENEESATAAWRVKRNGQSVSISEVAVGTLDNAGGFLQFTQPGEYELTVSVEDALGSISSCTRPVTVYPVVSISIDLPDIAHTDEEITLSMATENLGNLPICWTGTLNGEEINPSDYIHGVYADMERLSVSVPGTYTLTATVTDETGRIYTATDAMTCYPVGSVGFFLPYAFHTDDTVLVEAVADNELMWQLMRNGVGVSLERYIDGTLMDNGGYIHIKERGDYTLTASYVDETGRTYSYEQSFTVYPVPTVTYSLPVDAWTDTGIVVSVQTTDTEAVNIEWLVDNTYGYQDWNTFVAGSLNNDGGTIRFKRAGTYELVARITDATGRVFLYEVDARCEVLPVLNIRIVMPELFRVDKTVDIRTSGNNNILPVEWSLQKDGQSVLLADFYDGTLNAYGGKGTFRTHGDYVLTASMTDVLGRTFSVDKSFKVYPIATYSFELPEECHIGTPITVNGGGEYLEGCTIAWEITKDGEHVEYVGELDDDGGEIVILTHATGVYTLTATIADPYGNLYTAEKSIEITNTAPDAPTITVDVDYFDTLNTYTPECQVKVNIFIEGNDPDGDGVGIEWDADSVESGYFGVGTYTVKARTIDSWSLESEWAEYTFTISSDEPDVDLFCDALGNNDGINWEDLVFNLEISRGGPNQIGVADYHNPDNLDSISTISVSEDGSTINGWFAHGRHVLLVKVVDVFGNTAYGAKAFIVSDDENQDKSTITSLSTTITEEGLYDGDDLLAYIGGFTFRIPGIPGHSTSCNDVIEIYGVTEDGTEKLVLSFYTNNGYVYAHSGGTYEYTQRGSIIETDEWSGWEKQKYTKMIFHYEMTAGHESCIANATEGLSYRVRYSFIPEQLGKIEALFSQVEQVE